MSELDYQREIVEAARAEGGFAMKLSHRFMVGVPDLLIKLPGQGAALVECKFHPYPKRHSTIIDLTPTPQQLRRLASFAAAGGAAGMFHFSKIGSKKVCLVADLSRATKIGAARLHVAPMGDVFEKPGKSHWPINNMIIRLYSLMVRPES